MKKLLIILISAIALQAGSLDSILNDAYQDRIIQASSTCFSKHPVLVPQAKDVLGLAIGVAISKNSTDIETMEKAVIELRAFRKNVIKLCSRYNNVISDAFSMTSGDVEATYELTGLIAGVGAFLN